MTEPRAGDWEGFEKDVPTYTGELRGYRAWRYRSADDSGSGRPTLSSVSWEFDWPTIGGAGMEATCGRLTPRFLELQKGVCACSACKKAPLPQHEAPAEWCTCGLYAYYTLGAAREQVMYHSGDAVLGVVAASGRIALGTRGFRAQRARVVALVGRFGLPGIADVPSYAALVERFPPENVEGLVSRC